MDAEHKRPLAAFIVVSLLSALLLGQSLHSQSVLPESSQSSDAKASTTPSTSVASPGRPSSGQAVDGITAPPTILPVKSIAPTPRLVARGEDGLDVAPDKVRHQASKPAGPSDDAPSPVGSRAPEAPEPSGPPAPEPSGPRPGPGGATTGPGHGGPPSHAPVPTPHPHGPRGDAVPSPPEQLPNGVTPGAAGHS